jgi:uncharacterized Zn-finger protein
MPFVCSLCDHGSARFPDLRSHFTRTHTSKDFWHCDHPGCGFGCKTDQAFTQHSIAHGSVRPFSCVYEECEATFSNIKFLLQHVTGTEKHSDGGKPHICPAEDCTAAFATAPMLAHHHSQSHLPPITCDDCGSKIRAACAIKAHRKSAMCKAALAKKAEAAKKAAKKSKLAGAQAK